MKVYVFGNIDLPDDNKAILAARKLKNKIPQVDFFFVSPNQDLPFVDEEKVIILDTAYGISGIEILTDSDLDKLTNNSRGSVHDFDLAFQLKYLKKIGKLKKIFIIGIPMRKKDIDYLRIQSILRKLVAQDMQGS